MVTLKKMLTLTQTSYYSVLFFSFSLITGCSPNQGHPLSKYVEDQLLSSATSIHQPLLGESHLGSRTTTGTCLSPQS